MDREFENLRRIMPERSTLNTNTAAEYVPEIEQQIRVIKECARDICSTLILHKVLVHIVVDNILFLVLWLNALAPVGGISQIYYSRKIMTDCTLYYSKECRVEFGTYTKTHEDATIINNMAERLQGYIYIWTTKKLQDT